mmetsp:Transcript_18278/g.45464  ORF Transcript_18278/g.45464 Transcript_18278/m.45464 type:complete len:221 (+) Transcript_18278:596-1258(+)
MYTVRQLSAPPDRDVTHRLEVLTPRLGCPAAQPSGGDFVSSGPPSCTSPRASGQSQICCWLIRARRPPAASQSSAQAISASAAANRCLNAAASSACARATASPIPSARLSAPTVVAAASATAVTRCASKKRPRQSSSRPSQARRSSSLNASRCLVSAALRCPAAPTRSAANLSSCRCCTHRASLRWRVRHFILRHSALARPLGGAIQLPGKVKLRAPRLA